jgi:hypothetical protein
MLKNGSEDEEQVVEEANASDFGAKKGDAKAA